MVVSEKWNQQIDMATLQEHLRHEFAVGACHTVIENTELFSLVVKTHMLAFQDVDDYIEVFQLKSVNKVSESMD